jgi:2-keto-3-deoxy-L-rhamnonate aldolase RhmA
MKSAQILREKIASNRPVLGMLLAYDLSIELIELSMKAGLDYAIIDGEHLVHAQLDEIRAGVYMPPRGVRRPGGRSNRWLGTFNYENFKTIVEDDVIIIAQIESPQGIDNADAIAADDMVTAMGIGPFDLSAKLGLCHEPGHPTLLAAWDAIHTSAKNAGKSMWAIGDAKILHDRGLRFICIGEPMVMLENVARGVVEQLQSR